MKYCREDLPADCLLVVFFPFASFPLAIRSVSFEYSAKTEDRKSGQPGTVDDGRGIQMPDCSA